MPILEIKKSQPPRIECNWASSKIKTLTKINEFYLIKNILLYAIMFVGLTGFTACKDDQEPPTQQNPLIGTHWKLVEVVDVENSTSREPDYDLSDEEYEEQREILLKTRHYRISFFDISDRTGQYNVFGVGMLNHIVGEYFLGNAEKLSIKNIRTTTEAGHLYDEIFFIKCLNKVHSFAMTDQHLKLFYNDGKNYLLFIRKEQRGWFDEEVYE